MYFFVMIIIAYSKIFIKYDTIIIITLYIDAKLDILLNNFYIVKNFDIKLYISYLKQSIIIIFKSLLFKNLLT